MAADDTRVSRCGFTRRVQTNKRPVTGRNPILPPRTNAKMELKRYFCATVVLFLNARQCHSRKFDCDHPDVRLDDEVRVFDTIPGFKHSKVGVIYDIVYNRTLFLSVVLDLNAVTNTTVNATDMFGCAIDYSKPYAKPFPENPGLIIPLRFGGSCNTMNTYPVNEACADSLETFEKSTVNDVQIYGDVKYCVKLFYPDLNADVTDISDENQVIDDYRMPNRITINTFTYPTNNHVHSMEMNNNLNSLDCKNVNRQDD